MIELIKTGAKYRVYSPSGWNVVSMRTKAKDVEFDDGTTVEDYLNALETQASEAIIAKIRLFNSTWDK